MKWVPGAAPVAGVVALALGALAGGCERAVLVADDGVCGGEVPEALAGGDLVLEGDILLSSGHVLQDMSEEASYRSAVKCRGTLDRAWDVGRKRDLSYCLGEFADATLRARTREALVYGAAQWERASGVNFIHRAELDGTPECAAPEQVAFTVRQGSGAECGERGCPLGSASFPPGEPEEEGARLLIWPDALASDMYSPEMVVLHELGHLLGFVHEHSRFEQSREICIDAASTEFRGLTYPDPSSVMGDARCPGISAESSQGRLSRGDRLGAAILYGLPKTRVDVDGDGREDVVWFVPGGDGYEVWYGAQAGRFARRTYSLCGGSTPCPSRAPRSWRPVALTGEDGRTGVLMFGPEEITDELWLPPAGRGGFSRRRVEARDRAVPIVGAFAADGGDAVWWWRPGAEVDARWVWRAGDVESELLDDRFAAGYGWPLVGLWTPGRGSGAPRSQVLWLDAQRFAVELWAFGHDSEDMLQRSGLPACGLRPGDEQVGRVGDFDGDGVDEALWWDPRARTAVRWHPDRMWREDGSCAPSGWSRATGAGDLLARVEVGEFDGDGADDALWWTTGPDAAWLWRMVGPTAERVAAPVPPAEATPCIGDFDGDGCDDVLWHAPRGTSRLWRARCAGEMAFETAEVAEPPPGGYPVGCGG
ncbi:FG-GAP-like repeat-containing protein [Nannocystis radixulma]|uniref:M12 family metallopeptidase n=1 Tax=Nannocystis radixulma TaxID=2995305 RepID=A0ABT5B159_9BACT|nr:FG-GAP-like repeat-containing protein [Nannocystis radixulma]MDC0667178.1 M12 family metallopeptidase [Nannocystis radixulma]